jgi:hypothetical protein
VWLTLEGDLIWQKTMNNGGRVGEIILAPPASALLLVPGLQQCLLVSLVMYFADSRALHHCKNLSSHDGCVLQTQRPRGVMLSLHFVMVTMLTTRRSQQPSERLRSFSAEYEVQDESMAIPVQCTNTVRLLLFRLLAVFFAVYAVLMIFYSLTTFRALRNSPYHTFRTGKSCIQCLVSALSMRTAVILTRTV